MFLISSNNDISQTAHVLYGYEDTRSELVGPVNPLSIKIALINKFSKSEKKRKNDSSDSFMQLNAIVARILDFHNIRVNLLQNITMITMIQLFSEFYILYRKF